MGKKKKVTKEPEPAAEETKEDVPEEGEAEVDNEVAETEEKKGEQQQEGAMLVFGRWPLDVEMTDKGLMEVSNPSQILLSERPKNVPGSVVVPTFEGTRALLVETQALVAPVSSGFARRRSIGIDFNRANLLIAVLERKTRLNLSEKDIYVSIAGGVKVQEPAIDLGVAVAIASSLKDASARKDDVVFGELGLAGEARAVSQANSRVAEAARLGFKRCILPRGNLKNVKSRSIELIGVENIIDAIRVTLK